ncbi:MAG: FGLLP motif-containing membrane protein [Candidatus Dormiibacterota bacterium]
MPWRRVSAAVFAASLIGLMATTAVASAPSGLSTLLPGQFASIPASELPGAPAIYDDATCPSSENCYVVGSASGEGIVTRTNDAGVDWTTASISGSGQLDAISCPTAETCYVGGSLSASGAADPQVFVTQNGGNSWAADSVPSGAVISSIGCGSVSICMAVGSTGTTLQSSVIATHDGGSSWVSETPPTTALTTVRCVDVSHCWAAGPGAWFTANQGASWQDMSPPEPGPPPGTGFRIGNAGYSQTIDIEFTSPSNGWVVGGDQCGGQGATECPGIAYHTTDGGATWKISADSQKFPFGWEIACQQLDCLMVDQKFASSEIVDTVNDGNSWFKMQDLPTLINALACTPGRTLCVAAGGNQSGPALLTLGAKPVSKNTGPAHTLALVGEFDLTVSYDSYQGGTPAAGAPPVGHSGRDVVDFVYSCPEGQQCGVRMTYPNGSSSGGLLAPGDLFGPPSTVPLRHSGDHYYLDFESSLLPPIAPPSSSHGAGKAGRTVELPVTPAKVASVESCSGTLLGESELSLDITGFTTKNGEQVADAVTGTERWPAVRDCSGNAFDHWIYANLTINGISKGSSAPLTVNSISSALITPAEAFGSPAADALAALITILTVIFITFPAQLFNYTLKANYEEVRKWWEGPLHWFQQLRAHTKHVSVKRRDLVTFGSVVLLGAVLDGFLDPKFGFSASSALTLASLILALLVSIAVPNLAAFYYRKLRHRPTTFRLHALPAGLTVALVSVLISRVTSFEPGYLYGLVCGVAFTTQLAVHEDGHVAGVSSLCSMLVAVVAWLIWVPVHSAAVLPGAAAWQVLLSDLLAAVFVGGLVGNVVGLLPLNFMQGGTLAKWHKGAWAAVYGVTTFGFIQTMLQPKSAVANHSSAPVITALILFILFGGGSIAFYLYFARKKREGKDEAPANQDTAAAHHGLWNQFLVGIGRTPRSPSTAAAVQAATPPGEPPS